MINIKRCKTDRKRLVLQIGDKFWHINYAEGRRLLNQLRKFKFDRRKNNE